MAPTTFRYKDRSSRISTLRARIFLSPLPTYFPRDNQRPVDLAFSVLPSRNLSSTGILTCFPSTTPFGLALGTDSPYAVFRCTGNLGLPASGLFTRFIVTHVSIRTSDTSSRPLDPPSSAYRTLPYHASKLASAASVHYFSPVKSSAQADSTSELLRFL